MTPEQTQFMLHMSLEGAKGERETTKKVIAAVPDGGVDYKPHEKSMSAMKLMWHIVSSEAWFYSSILNGSFSMEGDDSVPADVKNAAGVNAWYDKTVPPLMESLAAMPIEKLAQPLSFFGMFNFPAVMYLNFMHSHSVHHRGQLSVYLRGMGAKVPSIYGGSADEPFEPPPAA